MGVHDRFVLESEVAKGHSKLRGDEYDLAYQRLISGLIGVFRDFGMAT